MVHKDIVFHNLHELFKKFDKDDGHQKINNNFFIIKETYDLDENDYQYPFRTDNTAVMLITEGEADIQINFEQIKLKKDDILILTPNSIFYPVKTNSPLKAIGIVFNDSFVQQNVQLHMHYINEIIFFSERNTPVLRSDINERAAFKFLIDKIRIADEQENYYSKDIINHYFNALLLELMVMYRLKDKRMIDTKTWRKKDLINQFLVLLSEHSKKERTVEFYAEKLFISTSYLTRIIKEASGESTRTIITNSVIMEARDLLLYSNLSITQIAEELNFSDQSFFGKFFKKKMKMSPKMFRARNK
ncbi:helix-turn-helix domain-containing protein [Chryseobacterium tongliaoense]|uniref:helix-turn-helix domain-containing protein n=1 Tax=Chryseobacterium tongliaoense TaxID=3240933 RepID=UPI0035173AFE